MPKKALGRQPTPPADKPRRHPCAREECPNEVSEQDRAAGFIHCSEQCYLEDGTDET